MASYLRIIQSVCVPHVILVAIQAIVGSWWKVHVNVRHARLDKYSQEAAPNKNGLHVLFQYKKPMNNLTRGINFMYKGKLRASKYEYKNSCSSIEPLKLYLSRLVNFYLKLRILENRNKVFFVKWELWKYHYLKLSFLVTWIVSSTSFKCWSVNLGKLESSTAARQTRIYLASLWVDLERVFIALFA